MENAKTSKGLTIEDAQQGICEGTYGNKTWSADERQAACQRHEQMVNGTYSSHLISPILVSGIVFAVIILSVVAFKIYKNKTKKKSNRKAKK